MSGVRLFPGALQNSRPQVSDFSGGLGLGFCVGFEAKKPDGVGPFAPGVQVSAQNGEVSRGGVLMLQRPDGLTIVAAD